MNRRSLLKQITVIAIIAISAGRVAAADDWQELLQPVPTASNAVLVIDAERMFASPVARQNGWQEAHTQSFELNPTLLPPLTKHFILAAELDIEHFEALREFAVLSSTRPISMEEIQRRTQSVADTLGGFPAVRTRQGSYVIPLGEQRVAIVRAAQRQWISQQLRLQAERTTSPLTGLLAEAAKTVADGEAQICLAVSLADVVPASELRAAIGRSTVLAKHPAAEETVLRAFTSLEGFLFTIQIGEQVAGKLEMVFADEPQAIDAIAKPLMLEILAGAGASLPDFEEWQPIQGTRRFGLAGQLSIDSLRRVLSLLQVDTSDIGLAQSAEDVALNKLALQQRDTKRYIERVTRLVESISKRALQNDLRGQVLWTDRTAKTITRLPTHNVDSHVLELGQRIARKLFDIVSAFNYAAESANNLATAANPPDIQWRTELVPYDSFKTPGGRFFRYMPFSYAQINIVGNQVRSQQISHREIAKANADAQEILSEIKALVDQMNRPQ